MTLDYTIRIARPSELPTAAKLVQSAFRGNEIFRAFAPLHLEKPYGMYHWTFSLMRRRLAQPHMRLTVAVENGTGRILGYGAWEAIGSQNPVRDQWVKEAWRWWLPIDRYLLSWEFLYNKFVRFPFVDQAVIDEFIQESSASASSGDMAKIPENQLHLHTLAVSPDLYGQGIGKRLLDWGLEKADANHLAVTIESSAVAVPMYKKSGFREVASIEIAKGRPGKAFMMPILLRDPVPLEKDSGLASDVVAEGTI